MHRELKLALVTVVLLGVAIGTTQYLRNNSLMGIVGTGLVALGGFLVAFGFWGADYAFSVGIGELDQSHHRGKVKGEPGKVYVPFVGNYTPVEWWNINWFVTTVGVFCLGFGAYFLGLLLGRLGL